MTEKEYTDSQYYNRTLGERNFHSVNESFKKLEQENYLLKIELSKLKTTIGSLLKKNQELTTRINLLYAKNIGTGATT